MKIAIGNDHAGPEYKKAIVAMLQAKGYEVLNFGTDTTDSVDYPDFGHPVAEAVSSVDAASAVEAASAAAAAKVRSLRAATLARPPCSSSW